MQQSKPCVWLITQTECSSYRPFFKSPSWLLPVYSILYEESFCSQVHVCSARYPSTSCTKFKMAECHSIRYYDNISSTWGFISAVLHIIIMKILILVLAVHSCTFRVNCACKSGAFHFRLVLVNNFRFSDCRLPWKISFFTRVNSLGFNMADMSMVEILKTWHEGVSLMEKGNFQDALMNFIALEGRTDSSQTLITSGRNLFNIGQTYRALGNLDRAAKVLNCLWQSFRDFLVEYLHRTFNHVTIFWFQ